MGVYIHHNIRLYVYFILFCLFIKIKFLLDSYNLFWRILYKFWKRNRYLSFNIIRFLNWYWYFFNNSLNRNIINASSFYRYYFFYFLIDHSDHSFPSFLIFNSYFFWRDLYLYRKRTRHLNKRSWHCCLNWCIYFNNWLLLY